MAEITCEQLTGALCGMEIVVDIIGGRVPGEWTGAKPRYPESLAQAILARIAAPPGDDNDRARIAEINECARIGPRCDRIGGPCTCPDPAEFPPTHIGADPELAAIARILAELDALDGESGAGRQSALRALTYVASRYGYVPADEED
jgi:hypothetical protein